MNPNNEQPTDHTHDDADENEHGLKAKITGAIDTVKQRIEEYHEKVENHD